MIAANKHLSNRVFLLISAIGLLLMSAAIYRDVIDTFPSHIHAWTQSDRLALAHGFLENDFDFFHPSTFNLRPEYEATIPLIEEKGITQVDFPVVEYFVAAVMKITGLHEPLIFRMFVLLISLTGILFLGLGLRKLSIPLPLVFVVMIFVYSAPVYTYFQTGFIPGVPAFAAALAGIYFFVHYGKSKVFNHAAVSVFLLTLAALIRLPFVIPLSAVLLSLLITNLHNIHLLKRIILLSVVSSAMILGYYIYNSYLGYRYGSIFLGKVMPAASFQQGIELAQLSWSNWKMHYFTVTHYLVISIAFILFFYRIGHFFLIQKALVIMVAANLVLAILYVIIMIQQFVAHDYYLIDSLFLPLILVIAIGFSDLKPKNNLQSLALWAVAFVLGFFMLNDSLNVQEQRYTTHPWDRAETTRINFSDSKSFLEKAGIPDNAKILVLDAYTNNAPLLLMNRKGYTVINTSQENIEKALHYSFDFIVMQNCFIASDVLANYPDLRNRLTLIANNGKIGIYTLEKEPRQQEFKSLLGISEAQTILSTNISQYFSETKATDKEFIPLLEIEVDETFNDAGALLFESEITRMDNEKGDILLVYDLRRHDSLVHYESFSLLPFFKSGCHSCRTEVYMNFPHKLKTGDNFKCYLWNRTGNNLVFQSLDLQIIQHYYQFHK
ncbi:MAG: hypothetical protein Q8S18_10940 [Bacteroidales bacterium]|nr:hypothetical protein [Bacteroidales bacterium]